MKPPKTLEQAISIYQQFPENPGAQERLGELMLSKLDVQPTPSPCFEAAVAKSPTEEPIALAWRKPS